MYECPLLRVTDWKFLRGKELDQRLTIYHPFFHLIEWLFLNLVQTTLRTNMKTPVITQTCLSLGKACGLAPGGRPGVVQPLFFKSYITLSLDWFLHDTQFTAETERSVWKSRFDFGSPQKKGQQSSTFSVPLWFPMKNSQLFVGLQCRDKDYETMKDEWVSETFERLRLLASLVPSADLAGRMSGQRPCLQNRDSGVSLRFCEIRIVCCFGRFQGVHIFFRMDYRRFWGTLKFQKRDRKKHSQDVMRFQQRGVWKGVFRQRRSQKMQYVLQSLWFKRCQWTWFTVDLLRN